MTQEIDFTRFESDTIAGRLRLLISNIERDPNIAQSVRTIKMFASSEKDLDLSHTLIEGLPQLRTLDFTSVGGRDNNYPSFLYKSYMPSLQNIVLGRGVTEESTLWLLMSLQGLELL